MYLSREEEDLKFAVTAPDSAVAVEAAAAAVAASAEVDTVVAVVSVAYLAWVLACPEVEVGSQGIVVV